MCVKGYRKMTNLKGTGREYKPVGAFWVFVYLMYMIGVVTTVMFFSIGWVFFF
jgi:hypothetical protein